MIKLPVFSNALIVHKNHQLFLLPLYSACRYALLSPGSLPDQPDDVSFGSLRIQIDKADDHRLRISLQAFRLKCSTAA